MLHLLNLDPTYQVGRLEESVQLTISGSEVKIFKARVDGKTNFVSVRDVKNGSLQKHRPHDVIFDLIVCGKDMKQGDLLEENLLFVDVPLEVAKSSHTKGARTGCL